MSGPGRESGGERRGRERERERERKRVNKQGKWSHSRANIKEKTELPRTGFEPANLQLHVHVLYTQDIT